MTLSTLHDFAQARLLISQLLKFTTKKENNGWCNHKASLTGWHQTDFIPGFLETFPFHPRHLQFQKASGICNALILGRVWMKMGELGEQMDGYVWCVFPATSLTAVAHYECNREGNWKWRGRISIVLGLIKPVLLRLGSGHQKFNFTLQISVG